MANETTFQRAVELIAGADAIIIAAGAGIGVDSGLPDFRSNNGFWKTYPALASAQLDFMEVASPRTFENDPELAWGFYGHRLKLYRDTVPHEGFSILKEWAEAVPLGAWIYTSNVDGAFQKAGFSEETVHECHGSIHWMQCLNDCQSRLWPAEDFKPDIDSEKCRLLSALPSCPSCKGLARPNILMFGDWNWNHTRTENQRRNEAQWLETLENVRGKVVVIEMGAGSHSRAGFLRSRCGQNAVAQNLLYWGNLFGCASDNLRFVAIFGNCVQRGVVGKRLREAGLLGSFEFG